MTKDEIVRSLRVCGRSYDCLGCYCKFSAVCRDRLLRDAADLIEQQAAKIKEFEREANRYATADEHAKLEKLGDALKDIVRGLRATADCATISMNASVDENGAATVLTGYFTGTRSRALEIMKRLEACLIEAGLSGKGKETVRNE